jgi:hypothetical protein
MRGFAAAKMRPGSSNLAMKGTVPLWPTLISAPLGDGKSNEDVRPVTYTVTSSRGSTTTELRISSSEPP